MGRAGGAMARLVVASITAQDFLSYREPQTLVLGGRGSVAIIGANGSGKSTLASKALSWALYGMCSPERMGVSTRMLKGKDVVRKRLEGKQLAQPEAEEAVVTVVLWDSNESEWIITRKRPRGRSDSIEVRCCNDKNGVDEIIGTDQATIDALIGADHNVFTRTVLRGQNDPWNFAEATDAKKREILDAISGADRLAITYERAIELRKDRTQQVATYRERIEDAERRAGALDLGQTTKQAAAWGETQAARVASMQQEVTAAEARLIVARQEDATAATALAERARIEANRPALDLREYDHAIEQASFNYMQAKAEYDSLEAEWKKFEHLRVGGSCPTCHEMIRKGSEIDKTKAALASKQPEKIKAVQVLHKHWRECQDAKARATEWLDNEIMQWKRQLDAIPAHTAAQAPIIEAQLDQLRRRASEAEAAQNPFTIALVQVEAAKRSLEREVAVYREEEIRAESERRLAAAWEEVLHPKGVRAHLAETTLAAIE